MYKAERELARQNVQNKKGKEEGKESEEIAQQIWQCKNGASEKREPHFEKASLPKTGHQVILEINKSNIANK